MTIPVGRMRCGAYAATVIGEVKEWSGSYESVWGAWENKLCRVNEVGWLPLRKPSPD